VPAFLPPGLFPGWLWVLVYLDELGGVVEPLLGALPPYPLLLWVLVYLGELGGVVEPLRGALPPYPLPWVPDQPAPGEPFQPEFDHLVPPPLEPVCVACDELGGGELPMVAALACSTELSASATVPASTAMPASDRGLRGLRPISRLPWAAGRRRGCVRRVPPRRHRIAKTDGGLPGWSSGDNDRRHGCRQSAGVR
jgi:hypothetical protein